MGQETLEDLRASVTHIMHCAGLTRFTLSLDEARSGNVQVTRSLLAFAATCPRLLQMGCLSTLYVAGRRSGVISERDCGDMNSGFVNTYEQSKFEMEEIVREAMLRLPIAIYRLGTLIGDSRTGHVRHFNAVHHSLRLLYAGLAPMLPGYSSSPVELISDDYASAALHWLFLNSFTAGATYHLCADPNHSTTLGRLLDVTVEYFEQHRPSWRKRRIERPVIVDLATYELFVRSVEQVQNPVLLSATRSVQSFVYQLAYPKQFDRTNAAQGLSSGDVTSQPLLDYYPRVLRYCVENNWGLAVA
jgi:thioester reductase-like protein